MSKRVSRKELERRLEGADRVVAAVRDQERLTRARAEHAEQLVDELQPPSFVRIVAKVNGNMFATDMSGRDRFGWGTWLRDVPLAMMTGSPADRLEISITGIVK